MRNIRNFRTNNLYECFANVFTIDLGFEVYDWIGK